MSGWLRSEMRKVRWRWLLAWAQLAIAVFLFIFAPYQYAIQREVYSSWHRRAFVGSDMPFRLRLEGFLYGMNFPPDISSVLLGAGIQGVLGIRSSLIARPGQVFVFVRHLVFFPAVFGLWFLIGQKVERLFGERRTASIFSRPFRALAAVVGVFLFGACSWLFLLNACPWCRFADNLSRLVSWWHGDAVFDLFAAIWSMVLLLYSARVFIQTVRPRSRAKA